MPSSSSVTSIASLETFIRTHPLIDNHAHPLLLPSHSSAYPLESITSEAHGRALDDHVTSLAHFRAVKYLAEWLGCAEDWSAIKKKRCGVDLEMWTKKCFEGVQCVLMDDGLDKDTVEGYKLHDRFTTSPNKRIVRIEKVAEDLLEGLFGETLPLDVGGKLEQNASLSTWLARWDGAMRDAMEDPEVVGFKSVVCYRSGLDCCEPEEQHTISAFESLLQRNFEAQGTRSWRIDDKPLNDELVIRLCKLVQSVPEDKRKPVQFHCGLGDNDLKLQKANPACLEGLIKRFPEVPIILLHSAYPFTREAGYLAANYGKVWLDFGEVFPMLSRDGQKAVVKQMLELTPGSKLLWSSDGHWFPETYALANAQIRDVLAEVLVKRVKKGDLSIAQAASLTSSLFFDNSNKVYKLGLSPIFPPSAPCPSLARKGAQKLLDEFLTENPTIHFIRFQWVDYTALRRFRIVPITSVKKMLAKNKRLGITKASFSLLQNDWPSSDQTVVGQWLLDPDWTSLRSCDGHTPGYATLNCSLLGDKNEQLEVEICPRTALRKAIKRAREDHGIDFLVGFETEVTFLTRDALQQPTGAHAWSTSLAFTPDKTECVDEIVTVLENAGIEVMYAHAESTPGQFEFVTGPLPPLQAVDSLYFTRETIETIAWKHGYRATLHPKPFPDQTGTAAHMHISVTKQHHEFFAGVLRHLSAIMAFGMATAASYDRLQDGCWAGGTWNCWGDQNRETPLRLVDEEEAHWEVRGVDGTANAFLYVAAVISAGLLGVEKELKLPPMCDGNPALLSEQQRAEVGIVGSLPRDLPAALSALESDIEMIEQLGHPIVNKLLSIKEGEQSLLSKMDWQERWRFMVRRY